MTQRSQRPCLVSAARPAPATVAYINTPRYGRKHLIQQCRSVYHHSQPVSSPSHRFFSAPKSSWNANPSSRIGVCPISLSPTSPDRRIKVPTMQRSLAYPSKPRTSTLAIFSSTSSMPSNVSRKRSAQMTPSTSNQLARPTSKTSP